MVLTPSSSKRALAVAQSAIMRTKATRLQKQARSESRENAGNGYMRTDLAKSSGIRDSSAISVNPVAVITLANLTNQERVFIPTYRIEYKCERQGVYNLSAPAVPEAFRRACAPVDTPAPDAKAYAAVNIRVDEVEGGHKRR